MQIEQMLMIFEGEGTGYQFEFNEKELREIPKNPESNIDFIRHDEEGWIVGGESRERGRIIVSEEEKFKNYSSAINRFFLKKLRSYYILEKIPKIEHKTGVGKFYHEGQLDFNILKDVFKDFGIPDNYLIIERRQKNSIYVIKEDTMWVTGYIDTNGLCHRATKPLALFECLWVAFRRVILLVWLDEIAKTYFELAVSNKLFDGEEIASYL